MKRVLSLLLLCAALPVCPLAGATTDARGEIVAMNRLTEAQYRNTIADIFGSETRIYGRFEPDYRRDHLIAVGSAWTSVSPSGFEQYERMALGIAEQVLDEAVRDRYLQCELPKSHIAGDDCARAFLERYGERLFRRPLTERELADRLAIAARIMELGGDAYEGLEHALASLLVSPAFLFRTEIVEPDPAEPGAERLTGYSKAARLSYFLWNTTPDEALLAAAGNGELHTPDGLRRQVERLLASPRLKTGMRALFADMLRFDTFPELSKDAQLYPVFTTRVAQAMQEQTLRTLIDHLLVEGGDYRDLFTLDTMPMNPELGMVYAVPVSWREGWSDFRFEDASARNGLLSQASLLSLQSHAGSSSPTLRGLFVRETFLCQYVPPPPADVDFTMDEAFAVKATARERLLRHREEPMCAGCHQLMDPIGLTLEQFDGVGMFRTRENGALIDVGGELDGEVFTGARGLGEALREHPRVPACLVNTVYRYATGRPSVDVERELVAALEQEFAASGYRLRELLERIATHEKFYDASALRRQAAKVEEQS